MKKYRTYGFTLLGLVLLAVGGFLLKTLIAPQGILKTLPYLLIGLGCGVFGYGAGELLRSLAMRKNPDLQKQLEIDSKDERNMAITNAAKAKSYDMMLFLFAALMLAFALMGVELRAVLLLVVAYLLVVGQNCYYLYKYSKEM